MTRTPDEDYDVVLYECRNTWTVWLAGQKLGVRDSRATGIALARAVAEVIRKPAWLADDTGYPLTPIEPHIH